MARWRTTPPPRSTGAASCVGGDEGRAQVTAATAWFKDQEVVNIERMVCLLAPGDWRHVSDPALPDRANL